MGNCCCLVGGKKKRYAARKAGKSAPTFLDHDYDDDYDVDECLTSAHKHKNIRRGGGCNRANNGGGLGGGNGGGGGGGGGGVRRPKNSKNNKNFLATYLATDLANNTKAAVNQQTNSLLNNSNNTTIVCRAPSNENGNVSSSAALLSKSGNVFVDNMLRNSNNNLDTSVTNGLDTLATASTQPFPHPQKSTITYYKNALAATTNGGSNSSGINNLSCGVGGASGAGGRFFCGVSSNSVSSMNGTPSRRGCDNSQIMNNLSKGN
jgi:hypothetical protein